MSNILRYQGYTAHVEFDAEDQILHGRVAGIRDMVTFEGATVDALIADFHAAVDHYLAVCRQRGEAPQQPYLGRLLLRMDPATHAAAARQAAAEGKSLNAWATEVLKRAVNADSARR
jgi:predicted HicB family RNase H-like nuclease